jgi:hypothetical protein
VTKREERGRLMALTVTFSTDWSFSVALEDGIDTNNTKISTKLTAYF